MLTVYSKESMLGVRRVLGARKGCSKDIVVSWERHGKHMQQHIHIEALECKTLWEYQDLASSSF